MHENKKKNSFVKKEVSFNKEEKCQLDDFYRQRK